LWVVSEAGVTWHEQEAGLAIEPFTGQTGVTWLADSLQQAICIGSDAFSMCTGHAIADSDCTATIRKAPIRASVRYVLPDNMNQRYSYFYIK